ncbi:DUF881 domain-containing protein [Hoyosella rhizosphaerae]|uniref:Membrane protein n=1 Tax=Hoyosella rhizosphaerae TaxID=1755582 RepID=A0A916U8K3_9ACTN|nr:DUF881 domain-containing protein [Hoyosella rhizosphaerae]MBN4927458.1 DUF881 domain-containing protein [Hoyosella rhizosphaerae]GGC64260.1 membrane protein [Hoyosella rhizosphaerae]
MRGSTASEPTTRSAWKIAVPVVCVLAGVMLATAHSASQGGELRSLTPSRLPNLVREVQHNTEHMQLRRDELAAIISETQADIGMTDVDVAQTLSDIRALREPGVFSAQQGSGIVVTLTDAARDQQGNYPSGASPDDLVVHQQDMQSVLNALWAGGATAIQVQDQRLTAWSAPRCIGNTLLLHGRAYSPPYVISAVGDPDSLGEALDAAPGVRLYRQYAARYGLGYDVNESEDLTIVAHEEPLRLRYASPLEPQ